MSEPAADYISILIDIIKHPDLLPTPLKRPSIFRIDDLLRRVNEEAYQPQMVAIGPYHHGKHHLKMMEAHKLRYAQQFLSRRNAVSVDEYVDKLKELEDGIRDFYAESITLDSRVLLGMMLVDGCFIIELLGKYRWETEAAYIDDPIFQTERMLRYLQRDLLLFENQIPFFILIELFNMTKLSHSQDDLVLVDMALKFLGDKLQNTGSTKVVVSNEVDHLLGLVHLSWSPSSELDSSAIDKEKEPFIKCAINLQRAGIRFSAARGDSMFDVKFENGVMKIPSLTINDETECLLRNLIAYEQYQQNGYRQYFTDYATLMDCLVNSEKDVHELCSCGIFTNRLANDAALSDMFNKLRCNVVVNPTNFCYPQLFKSVNDQSASFLFRFLGELRYHFRNPMTVLNLEISCIAAILTAVQVLMSFYIKS